MNTGPKIALGAGIITLLIGSGVASQVLYDWGIADIPVPPSAPIILLGIGLLILAYATWRGSTGADDDHSP